jgi:hypothetical protein
MVTEIAIRRLYISDEEWNRTSTSWKQLKPLRNFNKFSEDDESVDQCFRRFQAAGFRIPYLVIEQWIYSLYYDRNTVNNYGWIDYGKATFLETVLSIDELKEIYVIQEFKDYVERRSKVSPFGGFTCVPEDLEYWKTHSTWRTPPIVLDVTTISKVPNYADINGSIQLIEGHTRLGYLLAMKNANLLQVHDHAVFILKAEF